MATISGRLLFDKNREAITDLLFSGIANVAIVLQNTATNATLAVLTNENGEFEFNNVPNGDYQIVEFYGYSPATSTPGDFSNASTSILLDGGITPPISFVSDPPDGATHLDCTIPNTLHIVVDKVDSINNFFLNGPVMYSPITLIMDESVVVSPDNLIKNADGGTFGRYLAGNVANVGAEPNPYTNLGTDFIYTKPAPKYYRPSDGEYTIQNIIKSYKAWWIISDHTYGNEIGRMMVINGDKPGSIIFEEAITVKPRSYYLFSSWILNIINTEGQAMPALGVAILNEKGEDLYRDTLGNMIPIKTTVPEWKQIGTVIHSGENTLLTIQFISMGPLAIGNDYIIDDIMFNEVDFPTFIPVKTVDKSIVNIGQKITYTITLEKPGQESLTNVMVKDTLPSGFVFVPDSVVINGINTPGINPNDGFSVPNILGGTTLTISFSAIVEAMPKSNPSLNTAHLSYSYSPVEGGISDTYDVKTNEVSVKVLTCDLSLEKTAKPESVVSGDYLTYTLTVRSLGPDVAENIVVNDTLSDSLDSAMFSTDDGTSWNKWTGSYSVNTLEPNQSITILIKALVKDGVRETIKNTATVKSDIFDTNDENNSSSTETAIYASADISMEKTAQPQSVRTGDKISYSLIIKNSGPDEAKNVVITDEIPAQLLNVQFSTDNGVSWKNWDGSYSIEKIANGSSVTVLITAEVSKTASGIIANTATVKSLTPDPNPENNTSETNTIIISPMQDFHSDIGIEKTANPSPCVAGELITYSLKIINNGPDEAVNVTLIDTISANVINPEFSVDNGQTWQLWSGSYGIETLANQESLTVLIKGTVNASAIGNISNTATITSLTPDPNPNNNTFNIETPVTSNADIVVTKTASLDEVYVGESISYTITVSNNGPANAQNIIVMDIIQSSLKDVQFSTDGETWDEWNGFHTINNLENNQVYTITITGIVSETFIGTLKNTAIVRSTTPDPDLTNNEAVSVIEVGEICDLSIVKCASQCNVHPCQQLVYKLKISNAGPCKAKDVILSDHISNMICNPKYSYDNGITWHKWTGAISLGNLAASSTFTLLIKGIVRQSAYGEIINTASVTSQTKDKNIQDNQATVITKILSYC